MEKIYSYLRHLLTGLAMTGTYLVSLGILDEETAASANAAGAALIDPLAGLISVVAAGLVRAGMLYAGFGTRGKSRPSGGGGSLPLGLLMLCTIPLAGLCLPSCAPASLEGTIFYRHPDTGAKGGMTFRPGHRPEGFFRVPVYDEDGNLVGAADLRGPLAGTVEPSK